MIVHLQHIHPIIAALLDQGVEAKRSKIGDFEKISKQKRQTERHVRKANIGITDVSASQYSNTKNGQTFVEEAIKLTEFGDDTCE